MKKILSFLLQLLLIISVASCGTQSNKDSNESVQSSYVLTDNNQETSAVVETEKNNETTEVTVTITIPASFYDDEEARKEAIENAQKNGFLSAKSNEDNSVSFSMTQTKQEELLNECKKNIDDSIAELLKPDKNNSFTDITYNHDCTEFTILVAKDRYSIFDSIYAVPFYSMGCFYQLSAGKKEEDLDVIVKFCNKDNTNEVINSGSYKNYINGKEESTPITAESQCNHTFENTVIQPTYYEKGYTMHTCTKCGYSYIDSEVEKLSYPLSKKVLYENNKIKMTLKDIEMDEWGDLCLNVEIENNSNKKLMFSLDGVSVNNYMMDPFWAKEIDAGKRANDTISFSK